MLTAKLAGQLDRAVYLQRIPTNIPYEEVSFDEGNFHSEGLWNIYRVGHLCVRLTASEETQREPQNPGNSVKSPTETCVYVCVRVCVCVYAHQTTVTQCTMRQNIGNPTHRPWQLGQHSKQLIGAIQFINYLHVNRGDTILVIPGTCALFWRV